MQLVCFIELPELSVATTFGGADESVQWRLILARVDRMDGVVIQ